MDRAFAAIVRRGDDRSDRIQIEQQHRVARFQLLRHFVRARIGDSELLGRVINGSLELCAHFMQLVLLQVAGIAMLFQFGNQRFGFALCLFEHLTRFVLRLAHLAFTLGGEFLLQSFGFVAQLLRFQMRLFRERALLFGDLAMIFGVGDDVFKAHLIAREPLVCVLNQAFRKSELA